MPRHTRRRRPSRPRPPAAAAPPRRVVANAAHVAARPDLFAVVGEVAGSRVYAYVGEALDVPPDLRRPMS